MTIVDFDIPMPDDSLQDVAIIEDDMEHDPDARQSFDRHRESLNE